MLLSVFLGALVYVAVQFAWYSPWAMGRRWLALKQTTADEAVAGLRTPTLVPESLLQHVAPAFLMSAAMHVLDLTLAGFPTYVFWVAVGGLFVLTAGPKYWQLSRGDTIPREVASIGDGALFISLCVLAAFVTLVGHRLY